MPKTVLILALMIGIFVIGIIISLDIVRSEMINTTTGNFLTFGRTMSDNLDSRIDGTMILLSTFVLNPEVLELINESNNEFEKIDDISDYMNTKESQWLSYNGMQNPMYDKLVNNTLSQKLETFSQTIKTSSDIDMFPEIYIVNKYGATIAENSRTTNWDQSNKLKFQNSKIYGSYFEDLHYDTSAKIWALGVSLAIYNDDEFVGMIKTAYAISDITQLIIDAKNEANHNNMKINVFTSDGQYVFSDGPAKIGDMIDDSINKSFIFIDNSNPEGSYIVDESGVNKLVVYTTSDGFRNFSGYDWIITISIPEYDFLEPTNSIQDILIILLLISVGVAIVMSIIMVNSIVIPILSIRDATSELSIGNFDVVTEIKSKDEIGELSASFDFMSEQFRQAQNAVNLREQLIAQKDDILLKFSNSSVQCCVGIIDIIDSTSITINLSDSEINDFYGIFINEVNKTIKKFNGVTVKNLGDGLLFYFPNKKNNTNLDLELQNVIKCCLDIFGQNNTINNKLKKKDISPINYRISITYGLVSIAKVSTSLVEDIFGDTVNQCAKINHYAGYDGVVIDNSVYDLVMDFPNYKFTKVEDLALRRSVYTIRKT